MKLLYLSLLAMIACCSSPRTIMRQANEESERIDNVSYNIRYLNKRLSGIDTTESFTSVWMKRVPGDSIMGYHVFLRPSDTLDLLYMNGKCFWIKHNQRKIDAFEVEAGERLAFHQAVRKQLLFGPFKDLNPREVSLLGSSDTDICLHHHLSSDPPGLVDRAESWQWIDPETYLQLHGKQEVDGPLGFQYDEWWMTDVVINSTETDSMVSPSRLPHDYLLQEVPDSEPIPPLQPGMPAPPFRLASCFGDTVDLKDLQGKIILLDFWYVGCLPCIKDLPNTQALHVKYKDNGLVVLGMNASDVKTPQRVIQFQERYGYTFSTLMSSRALDRSYKVDGYPCKYIIAPDQTIAYHESGWSPEPRHELDSVIQSLIK